MTGERGLKAAREATVQICDSSDRPLGQGLLLVLNGEPGVVLTCHHVIAETDPTTVRVRRAGGAGELQEPVPARLDEAASRPERDAVVLRVDTPGEVRNPLLHAIDPDHYDGSLRATGLTWLTTDNFGAELQAAARRLRVKVPHPPNAYTLPVAFRLKDPSDAQPGISGGVVLCEEGVVGLVHFARRDSPTQQRQAYLNPLSAWVEGLPALEQELEPFVEAELRRRADVLRAEAVLPGGGLLDIAGYRDDVYLPRAVNEVAAQELERNDRVMVVGRRLSGKTRLACELLHRHPNSIVVVPRKFVPPRELREGSSFKGKEVVLLFENMHMNPGIKPVEWLNSMEGVCERALMIATSRNDEDWQFVTQRQGTLVNRLAVPCVFISGDEGEDVSDEEGRKLADSLGLSRADFERRFDGTPGSLLVEPERPVNEEPELPPGAQAGTAVEAASPEQSEARPDNLPRFSSTFVGREREMRELEELLSRRAVVTLSSPDGRGKTRLAAHVATALRPRFPDGAWWVDLSSHSEPALVAPTAAAALGIHESASASSADQLVRELSRKRALIVLNGIDDVVAACAALVISLIAACPDLRVLCTGRSPLGIPEEAIYPVQPLSLSGPEGQGNGQSEAVRLFLERALRHVAEEELTEAERSRIAEIVGRLNGNPLAIELAAAHLADARVEQLAEELGAEELTSPADDPQKASAQRVDATLVCTLEGLDEHEARLFARLGAFAGSWSLTAAMATGGGEGVDPAAVPDLVRRLVDRSLLLLQASGRDQDRFRMLDSVRRRAQTQLDALPERTRVRRRHAAYYAGFVERAKARLTGPHASEWLADLEREEDNCRAALSWALSEREVGVGLRLGAALWWPWYRRSRFREGRRWLEELLRQAPPEDRTADEDSELGLALAEVLNGAGGLAYNQGDLDAAQEWYARSLALRRRLGEEALTAGSLNNLGLVARRRGDYERAGSLMREAVAVSRHWENAHWEAMHLNNLGNSVREQGEQPEEARQLQEESLTIFTRLGSLWGGGMAACDLGLVLLDLGESDDGGAYLAHSLEVRERINEPQGVAQSLNGLARFEWLQGDLEAGEERSRRALRIFDDIGDRVRAAESLEVLAIIAGESHRPRRAARLFAAAADVREKAGAVLPAVMRSRYGACIDEMRERLGEDDYRLEEAIGRRMSLREAIAEA
jgi:predicted ATPase